MSSSSTPALSVLDLVPVRTGQTTPQAIAASMLLAKKADDLGYRRYWFAEHHNMKAVASTTPPVLIAAATAHTSRIRLGSGGVMLPNHAPLIVGEQFAALEAIAPGRIDLGLGRAPGSDPVITQLLRRSGTTSEAQQFPDHVRDIQELMSPEGATVRFTSGGTYAVTATPAATSSPTVWLLGSSDFSAQLAAQMGLPYVFANHFAGEGLERAMALYRQGYQPSERHPAPESFVTANIVVAPTEDEAFERALPQMRQFARLRTNKPMRPIETIDEAKAAASDALEDSFIEQMRRRWFIGTPTSVAQRLREFAEKNEVAEIMVSSGDGAYADEPLDEPTGRAQTLELLADAM
ncbi:LLM class flavin-dependent oxidoreductase [Microbacterium amylolyticum]|uniref:Luciferase family oxidoreductase group 1 n=1 Tax=Microbacterium amylolyticum TaxID=936337 RepID=A0ABS4ZH69_9MICO|nr:LLM class flavin-dependent oxidoreductase [Microbacterium amylolyticum]MBP2436625.1 luciferase family oxidoreductase group 1 [Microbacterium amylolyticum]